MTSSVAVSSSSVASFPPPCSSAYQATSRPSDFISLMLHNLRGFANAASGANLEIALHFELERLQRAAAAGKDLGIFLKGRTYQDYWRMYSPPRANMPANWPYYSP